MTWGHVKGVLDWSAIGVAIGAFAQWLPPLAAAFSIVWIGMQIVTNWSRFVQAVKSFFNGGSH